jgi:hypothetical protein
MDRLDALEKLYNFLFEAGRNIWFHNHVSQVFEQRDADWTYIVLWTSAIAFVIAFVGALPDTWDAIKRISLRIKRQLYPELKNEPQEPESAPHVVFASSVAVLVWIGIVVAAVPTWYAFHLTRDNPAKKATEFAQSSSRWQDLREQVLTLRDQVIALKPDERVPEPLMRQILALNSKVTRIEDAEPKDNPAWIDKLDDDAWDAQVLATYGVPDKEVDIMKRDDPAQWARRKYGFVPDQKTLERLLAKPPVKAAERESAITAKR